MSKSDKSTRKMPRGEKTHKADMEINQTAERMEAAPREDDRKGAAEPEMTEKEEHAKDEHPTGRMTEGGYKSQGGNRI